MVPSLEWPGIVPEGAPGAGQRELLSVRSALVWPRPGTAGDAGGKGKRCGQG